jgi:vacuolar-type H+-ATPase subunit I/STV1
MKKENENIHLFMIEQEYKRSKAKQNGDEGFLRKAETPMLTKQNHASVIQELQGMHPNFGAIEEPELLQTTEEPEQVDRPQVEEQQDAPEVLDLLASLQKMRTEEQQLLETKEDLLATERDLQSRLVKEIDKKRKAIDDLKSEIPAIQNRCKQLGQVLGVDIHA